MTDTKMVDDEGWQTVFMLQESGDQYVDPWPYYFEVALTVEAAQQVADERTEHWQGKHPWEQHPVTHLWHREVPGRGWQHIVPVPLYGSRVEAPA